MKLRVVIFSTLMILTFTVAAQAQEYNIFYSGANRGVISIKRKSAGETIVTASMRSIKGRCLRIDDRVCPLIPDGEELAIFRETAKVIIRPGTVIHFDKDGSWTKTVTGKNYETTTCSDGYWRKSVVEGNTTTVTSSDGSWSKRIVEDSSEVWMDSDGYWSKTVSEGNTELWTSSHGHWKKTGVEENTETTTHSDGFWIKTVVDGNTETKLYPNGRWSKLIIDGNTEIWMDSDGKQSKKITSKKGYNVYITESQESVVNTPDRLHPDGGISVREPDTGDHDGRDDAIEYQKQIKYN